MSASPYGRYGPVLAVAVVVVLVFAALLGYRWGDASADLKIAVAERRLSDAENSAEILKHLIDDFGSLPNINMREWNASQKLTFTLEGKPLVCIGLLRQGGDVQSLACDWETWRNG